MNVKWSGKANEHSINYQNPLYTRSVKGSIWWFFFLSFFSHCGFPLACRMTKMSEKSKRTILKCAFVRIFCELFVRKLLLLIRSHLLLLAHFRSLTWVFTIIIHLNPTDIHSLSLCNMDGIKQWASTKAYHKLNNYNWYTHHTYMNTNNHTKNPASDANANAKTTENHQQHKSKSLNFYFKKWSLHNRIPSNFHFDSDRTLTAAYRHPIQPFTANSHQIPIESSTRRN